MTEVPSEKEEKGTNNLQFITKLFQQISPLFDVFLRFDTERCLPINHSHDSSSSSRFCDYELYFVSSSTKNTTNFRNHFDCVQNVNRKRRWAQKQNKRMATANTLGIYLG